MNLTDWFFGFVGLDITTSILVVLATTHFTFISITVYLHRYSAHRSLTLHPVLKHIFRFWIWFTTGMGTQAWTAVHRKHHALTETVDDPHSPKIQGLNTIVFRGVESYRDAITDETLERYGKGCPEDWIERRVYSANDWTGVGLLLVIEILLFGAIGVVMWGLQMIWTPFWAAGIINGLGHAFGYRNFECTNASTNIVPWGILICGEELHNNHHTYPNSPKLSVKKWEFDLGWGWIRLFELFGLAKPNRVGPIFTIDQSKEHIDIDTIHGVLNDRFNVMTSYTKQVVAPLVQSMAKGAEFADLGRTEARRMLRSARKVMCRDESLLKEADKAIRARLFKYFPKLEQIYAHRLDLLEVWSKRAGDTDELLREFMQWCEKAERLASELSVEGLQKFVAYLKSYSIPQLAPATA